MNSPAWLRRSWCCPPIATSCGTTPQSVVGSVSPVGRPSGPAKGAVCSTTRFMHGGRLTPVPNGADDDVASPPPPGDHRDDALAFVWPSASKVTKNLRAGPLRAYSPGLDGGALQPRLDRVLHQVRLPHSGRFRRCRRRSYSNAHHVGENRPQIGDHVAITPAFVEAWTLSRRLAFHWHFNPHRTRVPAINGPDAQARSARR